MKSSFVLTQGDELLDLAQFHAGRAYAIKWRRERSKGASRLDLKTLFSTGLTSISRQHTEPEKRLVQNSLLHKRRGIRGISKQQLGDFQCP